MRQEEESDTKTRGTNRILTSPSKGPFAGSIAAFFLNKMVMYYSNHDYPTPSRPMSCHIYLVQIVFMVVQCSWRYSKNYIKDFSHTAYWLMRSHRNKRIQFDKTRPYFVRHLHTVESSFLVMLYRNRRLALNAQTSSNRCILGIWLSQLIDGQRSAKNEKEEWVSSVPSTHFP